MSTIEESIEFQILGPATLIWLRIVSAGVLEMHFGGLAGKMRMHIRIQTKKKLKMFR